MPQYHRGAALLRNFFVDYRGGASTRAGTKYILRAKDSDNPVRLIPFQASSDVAYMLEFGEFYIRFYNNGAPVLETALTLTAATAANPAVFTKATHGLSVGDWVYASGFTGGTWTNLNGQYFIVGTVPTANTFTLTDLFGNVVSGVGLGVWTAGAVARVYTLASPYAAADLALLKFAQDVNQMILCHPDYAPAQLTLNSATSWTLSTISFGATIGVPGAPTITTNLGAGTANYAYVVTAVDSHGQESTPSGYGTLANKLDLRTTAGSSNQVAWAAVSGAVSYNVYKATPNFLAAVPVGEQFGFIGNVTGVALIDTNISPDFSLCPQIPKNPFLGAGVLSATVTASGAYATVPTVTIAAPGSGVQATGIASLGVLSATVASSGNGYAVGDLLPLLSASGAVLQVATLSGSAIATVTVLTPGSLTSGSAPATAYSSNAGGGSMQPQFNLTWGVTAIIISGAGAGYTAVPAITFSAGAAAATAVLDTASSGNPTVPQYTNQRLFLGGPPGNAQQFNLSQPAQQFNFNITNPTQADDAIEAVLRAGQLNSIRAAVPVSAGLLILTDRQSWILNGGSSGAPATATQLVANAQTYTGISNVPPIIANQEILFVQEKGSIVRDLNYNFGTNVYVGTDISAVSSHLFYGYQILEWAWAEEPFKVVWAVRDDGTLLSLTFLKEQEFCAWAHSDTLGGSFKSVATITEEVDGVRGDALYTVVERTVRGQTVKYIERMSERLFDDDAVAAWTVDCGLRYDGTPATSFRGGEHLAGLTVNGLADGVPITPFVMAANGAFTLPTAASVVTIGLLITAQLQTLALDISTPTVQGKMKKIAVVVVRCAQTLGLKIGQTFSTDSLVAMQDFVLGQIGSMTNETVTGLVTGDGQTIIDPQWSTAGQFCIEQSTPYPASILGVIPRVTVGD